MLEPDRLAFATLVATHVLHPEGETPTTEGETSVSLVAIAAAVAATHVLHSEGETPTSLVAVAAAVATGGEPVEPEQHAAADEPEQCALGEFNRLDGNAYATAPKLSGRADESLQGSANEPEQRAHGDPDGLDSNAYVTAAKTGVGQGECLPHASANEPEQRAHAEPNGLEGNASVTAGTEAGIASGFSDTPPETSTEALPTTRRELGMPLPAGNTPAKLASALRPPAPVGPRAESAEPEWLAIEAEILYAGSDSSSDGAFKAAAEASVDLTSWQDAPRALAPIVEEAAGSRARTGGRRRRARTCSGQRGHHRRHGHPRAHPAVPRRRQRLRCSGALGLQHGGPARAARHHWVPSHLPRLPRGRTRRLHCGHHRARSARICCASRLGQPRPQLAARFRSLFGGRKRRTRARRICTNRAFGGDGFEPPRVAAAGHLGTTTGTSAVMFLVLCFPGIQHVAGGGVRNLV